MRGLRGIVLSAAVVAGGCHALAGFPDYELVDDPATTAASGGATASSSTQGGAGGATVTASASGGTGGAGGESQGCSAAADCAPPNMCKNGACQPAAVWARGFGETDFDEPDALGTRDNGDVAVTFRSPAPTFALLSGAGQTLVQTDWSLTSGTGELTGVAWTGSSWMAMGWLSGVLETGSTLTSVSDDVLYARFDGDGGLITSDAIGGTNAQAVEGIVRSPSGIYAFGTAPMGYEFPGIVTPQSPDNHFVARFDNSAGVAWVEDATFDFVAAALHRTAGVALAATSQDGADQLVGTTITDSKFVAQLSASPGFIGSLDLGDLNPRSIATTTSDDVIVLGDAPEGDVDVAGTTVTLPAGGGILLIRLDGVTGALEWHRVFSADAYLLQVAVDTFDNCLAVGFLLGDVDLGGGMLSPGQSASVALVSLDESGNHRFSQSFGSGAAYFVAHDEDTGGFVIAGYYAGDLDLGGGALPFASDTDVFVAKLAP